MIHAALLCLVLVHTITPSSTSQASPLTIAYTQFENLVQDGCDVNVLPDSIDWCDDTLNKQGRLPVNTLCQSIYTQELYLRCRYTKWRNTTKQNDRVERSISTAYNQELNKTCLYFCDVDEADASNPNAVFPPSFTFCPSSATIYPEGNDTEVTYNWQTPTADDPDGDVASIEQIVGPSSNSSFNGSVTPGTNHLISYLATDDDNLNWTCSFTLTAEIPVCPLILHLENGIVDCTNETLRFSACAFICNAGYRLNGTVETTECQENGTWSNGDEPPECIPFVCDVNAVSNITDPNLDVVCGNITGQFGDVCWLQCKNEFLLRNDELESDVLVQMTQDMKDALTTYDLAKQEADDAASDVIVASETLTELENEAELAENITYMHELNLEQATDELNLIMETFNDTLLQLITDQTNLDDLIASNAPVEDIQTHNATVNKLIQELSDLNETIYTKLTNIDELQTAINVSMVIAEAARNVSDQAALEYEKVEQNAAVKEAEATLALELFQSASARYNDSTMYSQTTYKKVPTYIRCMENGEWLVAGNPYCIDIDPPVIKCLPVVTHFLSGGQTSAVVTWPSPEVEDNRNVTLYQLVGPKSGSSMLLGRHVTTYQAFDGDKHSLVCTIVINVQVQACEDIRNLIEDEHLMYDCDTFDVGGVCSLSCDDNLYPLNGPNSVTCQLDAVTQAPVWDWHNTTCDANCEMPVTPTDGILECEYGPIDAGNATDNSSAVNSTVGLVCYLTCKPGYMLPYDTGNEFICDEDGYWSPSNFPSMCLEADLKFATYTYAMQYRPCDQNSTEDFVDDLAAEVTSFPSCIGGHTCDLSNIEIHCDGNGVASVSFTVNVNCESSIPTALPWEATCDLGENQTAVIQKSLEASFVGGGTFSNLEHISTVPIRSTTDLCSSYPGSVLIGPYCAMCEPGWQFIQGSIYTSSYCKKCQRGTYTLSAGAVSCVTCPADTFTAFEGTYIRNQCKANCEAGTYSNSTVAPCVICPTGTYQMNSRDTACDTCPNNTWTTSEGSTDLADCIEYDLYFDVSTANISLTSLSTQTSLAFWMMSFYAPLVTVGFCYDDGECACTLEASEPPGLVFGWDNEPIDATIETGQWTMFGVTWDTDTGTVGIYKDSELLKEVTLDNLVGNPEMIVLSVGNTTMISGLSVSHQMADTDTMSSLYEDCSVELPGAIYTLDDLAATRHPAIKYAGSTCKASNATVAADHCALNTCENGGTCEFNATEPGYTCVCPENYGGPFCKEILVHGNWSDWMYSGECSSTCGPGTRLQYRYCNSPPRSEFGDDCQGNSTEIVECFMENCTLCNEPVVEGVTVCELDDDTCVATCPPGYVLPRGQTNQTFQCGQTTAYQWAPLHRLPTCSESLQPQRYSVTIIFTFGAEIPCDDVAMVTQAYTDQMVPTLHCRVESDECTATIDIIGCSGNRRKRSTHASTMELVLAIPLLSNVTFDLVEYYASLEMTESILEAVTSIAILEQTVTDVLNDPSLLSVTIGNVKYDVVMGTVVTTTQTHCAAGQVPVEAVCAQCQRGTYEVNGWCIYCGRGSYQNLPGQATCVICPKDQQTDYIGARDATECAEWPVTPPPEGPEEPTVPADFTEIIIIVVVCLLLIIIVILIFLVGRKFYRSAKDREKYDMEADRMSLYTDFPDIAYNIYFKRRQVVGFDEDGHPVIEKLVTKNGDIRRGEDNVSLDDGRQSRVSGKEAFAYPEPEQHEPPFQYDPYEAWSDDFVHPYVYPDIDEWDFPKIEQAIRYRVPGRSHMQNSYPFSQFGYTEKVKGRSRKNLPLPVNIPVPKKLPQLMYRKPETVTLAQLLRGQYGIKTSADAEEDEIVRNPVPPLPFKKKKTKLKSGPANTKFRPGSVTSTRSPRLASAPPRMIKRSPRSATTIKAALTLKAKLAERRSPSAISPRSISSGDSTPRPATTHGRMIRQNVEFNVDEDIPHPRPSRIFMPKDMPYPPKSALRDTSDRRPSTSLTTGRKSVTIKEDFNDTRPSTAATSLRPSSTATYSPFKQKRPSTDAMSARETIVAPHSARPRHVPPALLPSELMEVYRPTSSVSTRPITPEEHPRPIIHTGVTVKRKSEHMMLQPPPTLEFSQPPLQQKMRLMAPPAFINKINPNKKGETTSILTRSGKRVTLNLEDSDDDMDDGFGGSSLFLTEVPERSTSGRSSAVSSRRSSMKSGGKWAKKPSPPPKYSETADDKVIESSSIHSRRSNVS